MEAITTLATIPAVLALVELAKRFGVEGRWNMLLAVLLGVFIQVGEYAVYAVDGYSAVGWYQALATGLVLGLSASGLYDAAQTAGGSNATAPRDVMAQTMNTHDLDMRSALEDGAAVIDLDA